ncbi:MAG: NADH-quinone oxidoreductase subunit J [Verrucomicrobiota bacterium]
MTPGFLILAFLVIGGAVAAMGLRNLVHCALALTVTFAGLAMVYLQLDAQFVGFAQILVYIGAVAILIVFAILLTRSSEPGQHPTVSPGWLAGSLVAVAVLAVLAWSIGRSAVIRTPEPPVPAASVRALGEALMKDYLLPLEVAGLLLTAAMIGAVIIALQETRGSRGRAAHKPPPPSTHA